MADKDVRHLTPADWENLMAYFQRSDGAVLVLRQKTEDRENVVVQVLGVQSATEVLGMLEMGKYFYLTASAT